MSEQPGERHRNGQRPASQPSPRPPDRDPACPWRTEGLPPQADGGRKGPRRPRWLPLVLTMLLGYLVAFGLVERSGLRRRLGAGLLTGLVKKGARTKVGRMAKAKLETEGLA